MSALQTGYHVLNFSVLNFKTHKNPDECAEAQSFDFIQKRNSVVKPSYAHDMHTKFKSIIFIFSCAVIEKHVNPTMLLFGTRFLAFLNVVH